LATYVGSPPNCRPECTINSECPSNLACIREKCRDPCPGSCGAGARCSVINHTPICSCPDGYTGDPFSYCQLKPQEVEPAPVDPCNPSPCGPNARCDNGACTCLPEYQGDPYRGCRPECVLNSDCSRDKACIRNKCNDPCPGTCGQNAECSVINHIPTCSCISGYIGNAFVLCSPIPGIFSCTCEKFCITHNLQPLLLQTRVHHHHVVQTVNVERSITKLSALVSLVTSVAHQLADLSVLRVQSAPLIRLVSTRNVSILVLELAVSMLFVKLSIIIQFAVVLRDKQEIHLPGVQL
jgi:hypothetical protein